MNVAEELASVIAVRPATAEDYSRIFSDWLHSYWDAAKKKMQKTVYMGGQHRIIERLLKSGIVLIVCHPELPGHVFGWCVGERVEGIAVLHYCYVRKDYRGNGFARRLLAELRTGCSSMQHTHQTKDADRLLASQHSTFNPYIAGVAW